MEDQELKREFTVLNDSTIAAFENNKTYLEQELKSKADADFALGSDLFAKRMAYGEMVDIPPDRLLDIAYAQLHKDQGALSEAAREVDPTAPIEAVLKEIRAQHPTIDTLIPTARDELAGLRAFILDHHIATIPSDLLPKVEGTPTSNGLHVGATLWYFRDLRRVASFYFEQGQRVRLESRK